MNLQSMPARTASAIRHGGAAGVVVALVGLLMDSPTVVGIGLLTLVLATYAAIWTGNRTF